ncbi:Ankyrin repeat protein 1 [Giardia muris]|uniref:Ankyrin repeat protein 1 n=1 Tax=Giardia muris TaxID=5742 RepID=A0A4Z1SVU6_GIAMU|nr:Ankyrin repeat protein 1 [Giardia muris]|eukprot:TNJ29025.1 Ankyrin repeat protein 1 [Giardia muris]
MDIGWFEAARRNDVEGLRRSLELYQGTRDPDGWTALMHAAACGACDAIDVLQPETQIQGPDGHTALTRAILGGQYNAAKLLCPTEACLPLTCGKDPLMLAVESSTLDMIRLLAQYVPKRTTPYGWTALHFAVHRGDIDAVQYLVRQFAYTIDELEAALHDFRGPAYVPISGLIFDAIRHSRSNTCDRCQGLTREVHELRAQLLRSTNILDMARVQANRGEVFATRCSSLLNCSRDSVYEALEPLLRSLAAGKDAKPHPPWSVKLCVAALQASPELRSDAEADVDVQDETGDDDKRLPLNLKMHVALQRFEAAKTEAESLRGRLTRLEMEHQALQTRLGEATAAALKTQESLLASEERVRHLETENITLRNQLEALLRRDEMLDRRGRTPLMFAIATGELKVAASLVERFAGRIADDGYSALHLLILSRQAQLDQFLYAIDTFERATEEKKRLLAVIEPEPACHPSSNDRQDDSLPLYHLRNGLATPSELLVSPEQYELPRALHPVAPRLARDGTNGPGEELRREVQTRVQLYLNTADSVAPIVVEPVPLFTSQREDAIALLRALLPHEAGVRTGEGKTALELAIEVGNSIAIDLLAPYEATLPLSSGVFPIFAAIAARDERLCHALLPHSRGLLDEEGSTALMYCAQFDLEAIGALLLPDEARRQNDEGDTALIVAVANRSLHMVRLLASLEAEISNLEGLTAIHLAITLEDEALVHQLLPYETYTPGPGGAIPLAAALARGSARLAAIIATHMRDRLRVGPGSDGLFAQLERAIAEYRFADAQNYLAYWGATSGRITHSHG